MFSPKPTSAVPIENHFVSEPRGWWIAYLGAAVVSLVGVWLVLGLSRHDMSIPFEYAHDAFLVNVPIKTMVQEGWWLENSKLGAPLGMDFYDYPSNPSIHLALLKLMTLFETDSFRLMNYYYLLSFPLIAVCTLAAFRALSVPPIPAVFGALVFTFAPYHFWRGESHMWLACYFPVPLSMIPVIWILRRRRGLLFDDTESSGRLKFAWRTWPSAAAVGIAAVLGLDFPYYPIFACFMFLVAGIYATVRYSSRLYAARCLALIALVAGFFVLNVTPNLIYSMVHGKNKDPLLVSKREWNHAELYGLKIASLVLPAENHPIGLLRKLRSKYEQGTIAPSEGSAPSLGTVATIGFFILLSWLFFKQHRGEEDSDHVLDAMSLLNVATLLLATIGGFSAVANLLFGGALRGYNRISIYILFFSLVPIVYGLARLQLRLNSSRRQIAYAAGIAVVLILSSMETSRYFRIVGKTETAEYESDRKFVRDISDRIGSDAKVFQYPVQNFLSYHGPAICCDPYTHFRGYLHSDTITWSFGAVRGRSASQIQNWIESQAPEQAVRTLALMGFDAVYIDRRLYEDRGQRMENAFKELLAQSPVVSDNERLAFFSLKEFATTLRVENPPQEYEAMKYEANHPVLTEWHGADVEEVYPDDRFRWVRGKKTALRINNFGDKSRAVEVDFALATAQSTNAMVKISGLGIDEKLHLGTTPVSFRRTLNVPPGIHKVELYCDAEPLQTPQRNVTFRICRYNESVQPTVVDRIARQQTSER
jgi:phosphoglycerol transferase